jgi:hypothetical protein
MTNANETSGSLTLEGRGTFEVEHWFSPDRALIRFDGTYALVDRVSESTFDLSGQPASEDEKTVLNPLVLAVETTTTVTRSAQDEVLTVPAPLEDAGLDETGEHQAVPPAPPAPPAVVRFVRPGFCHCGTALSVLHVHADAPNLDKCWCGLYLSLPHSHAAAPERPIERCHCGILLSVPHEHATAYDPSERCECGLPKNPHHEHAGPRRY